MAMETWIIRSNPVKQLFLGCLITATGIVLAYGFRHFDASGMTNSLSGFLLGLLLLFIGLAALVSNNRRIVAVDPDAREIRISDKSRFREKNCTIRFDDIDHAYISRLGNSNDGSPSFDVVLKLTNGENYSLFRAAIFDGAFNFDIMEGRRTKLLHYLGKEDAPRVFE